MDGIELFIRVLIAVVSSGLMFVWLIDKLYTDYTLLAAFKKEKVEAVMPKRTVTMFTVGLMMAYVPVAMVSTSGIWTYYFAAMTVWLIGTDIAASKEVGNATHYKILGVSYIVAFCISVLTAIVSMFLQ